MERVAFYGTLRSAAPPLPGAPRLEALVRVLGPCVLPGTLHDVGSYPALVPSGGRVQGELCEVRDPAALAVLDAWEDFRPADEAGSEYVRRRMRLLEPDAEEAWTYLLNRPPGDLPVIAGGDWVAHVTGRGGLPGARRWAPSSG